MKIPSDPMQRAIFVDDLRQKCLTSREDRIARYDALKYQYENGQGQFDNNTGTPFRKIFSHIDLLGSFLYQGDTTRFSVHVGATGTKLDRDKSDKISQVIQDDWQGTEIDTLFSTALNWALCYGSMFVKKRWLISQPKSYVVYPHDLGVLREDILELDDQEAFVHCYQITEGNLKNVISGHPREAEILSELVLRSRTREGSRSEHSGILVNQTSFDLSRGGQGYDPLNPSAGQITASLNYDLSAISQYIPKVAEEMVDMWELYVWDDDLGEIGDYRVFTIADPQLIIFDRPNKVLYMEGEQPFTQIRPRPRLDYFWGESEVGMLIGLQADYNEEIRRVKKFLAKQENPPRALIGFDGMSDEMATALDTAGGQIYSSMPGGDAKFFWPANPSDLYQWKAELDNMFDEISGIPRSLKGQSEAGVRSEKHAAQMARVGSSRAKKRALLIEDSVEHIATQFSKLHRVYDKRHYTYGKDEKFIFGQMTPDHTIKVDAHSMSPIFMEDQKEVAKMLLDAKAIDRKRFIQLLNAPMQDTLVAELQENIEPQEAVAAKKQEVIDMAKFRAQGK